MKITISIDDSTFTSELTDSQAAALDFATNVFNGADGTATQAQYLGHKVTDDLNSWAGQRMNQRLAAVPQRLSQMPADKIEEAEVIFQIPPTYPDGKTPLPPYQP